MSLIVSALLNLTYGMLKLITGVYYRLWLLITFLLKDTSEFGKNLNSEYLKLKRTGIMLLLLNIVLSRMVTLFIQYTYHFSYPRTLIYLLAAYDFYLIISAFINVFKHRNNKSPVIIASKCISLTVAMICILSLEVNMIYEFGNNDSNFKLIMTSTTGFGICLINTIMSIIMIYKGKIRI